MAEPAAELVARAAKGDEQAWSALVDRYTGLLWAIARAHDLSRADAADVCQTTWLRLLERLDTLRDPDRVGAWLATTARHESIRTLRRELRPRPAAWDDGRPALGDPEGEVLTAERHRLLRQALAALPDRCRRLLRLIAAVPPASYSEVSAALGMPIGSIGPTRARCLGRLRTLLGQAAVPVHDEVGR